MRRKFAATTAIDASPPAAGRAPGCQSRGRLPARARDAGSGRAAAAAALGRPTPSRCIPALLPIRACQWLLYCVVAALGLLTWSQRCRAETLYRCIAPSGAVSYQGQACAADSRLDRTLEYRPDPEPTRIEVPAPDRPRARTAQSYRAYRSFRRRSRRAVVSATPSARCHAAKAKRRAALERLGLARTYAQLSRLDEPVRAVCHGF